MTLILCMCCTHLTPPNTSSTGALNKPVFNSSGSPYVDAQSPANFFKRSGGGFRAGKAPTRRLPPGAVHTSDSKSPKVGY